MVDLAEYLPILLFLGIALAISALLFANTLAVQTAEVHSVVGILA